MIFTRVGNDYPLYGKIKFFNAYDSFDIISLNLIPALRVSDSKPGMYDTVSNTFFINQGTGEFGYEIMDGTYVAPV